MHIGFKAFCPVVSNLQLQDGIFFALKLDAQYISNVIPDLEIAGPCWGPKN